MVNNCKNFYELASIEEKDAAGLEAGILCEVELISRQKAGTIPFSEDCYVGMGDYSEKLEIVATQMIQDSVYKKRVMSQFQMYPFDDREKKGYRKGIALQRYLDSSVNTKESTKITGNTFPRSVRTQKER